MFWRLFKRPAASLSLGVTLFLCGCASVQPADLGVSNATWIGYPDAQKKQLISAYQEYAAKSAELMREHNAPLDIGATVLQVGLNGGSAMFPPFEKPQHYTPVNFMLVQNKCAEFPITSSENKDIKTNLFVCYIDNTLYLDPSRFDPEKQDSSVTINATPLWQSGFSYDDITSTGFVRLNKVTISVQQSTVKEHVSNN